MIGACIWAPSMIAGSLTATFTSGSFDAIARTSFLRSVMLSLRALFGTATIRQVALFDSLFGPSVVRMVVNFLSARISFSAAAVRRPVSSSDVPAGNSRVVSNMPRSSAFMNSKPIRAASLPIPMSDMIARPPTMALWRTTQPSAAR
jgi:hypothetical protein